MNNFNNEERYDMISCYIRNLRNSRNAANDYLNRFPERHQPHETIFRRLEVNLKTYGSFLKHNKEPRDVAGVEEVLNQVAQNPETSTREIQRNTRISKSKVSRILRKRRYHPYKLHVSQALRPGDAERRLNYCNWFIDQCNNNEYREEFPFRVLWTDESRFTNNGMFNRHNRHYWSIENPRINVEVRNQHRFGFNVWCGILGGRIIGPIIFEGNLNRHRYLNMLQVDVERYLDEIPINLNERIWFQQDGCPAHNAVIISNYLRERFPGRWIANRGHCLWPARSPDLSPMDFFLWGYMKNKVYQRTYNNVEELRDAVLRAFRAIDYNTLRNVLRASVRRCIKCVECEGGLFEYLL